METHCLLHAGTPQQSQQCQKAMGSPTQMLQLWGKKMGLEETPTLLEPLEQPRC